MADGLAECGISRDWTVARPVVVDGLLGSGLHVVGGVEIGLSDTHVDDVDTLCLEFCTLLRHGKGGRGCKAVKAF